MNPRELQILRSSIKKLEDSVKQTWPCLLMEADYLLFTGFMVTEMEVDFLSKDHEMIAGVAWNIADSLLCLIVAYKQLTL